MPFGAERVDNGVRFALWAPTARSVELVLDGVKHEMASSPDGWKFQTQDVAAGARYGYRIDGDLIVPDPASRLQPDDVKGLSAVVDPTTYEWTDTEWRGRPWEETVLYETHVGTATPQGTFAALADDLERIKSLGITALELMPVNEFPGRRNWGYDGVLPFAPDFAYGTPDDLRRLVDRAHGLGLMVFVDVVYNHFGPAGNFLNAYARTFFTDRHHTPWGDAINFEGADGHAVREFFVHNVLYWLDEFHIDGLRFDAVHAILDDSETNILAEIATRARAANPDRHIHLVLENEANQARWLARGDDDRPTLHSAQWADDIHHAWHVVLTEESEGYYEDFADDAVARLGRAMSEGFVYQGETSRHSGKPRGEPSAHLPPSAFVGFIQNHDQIGNRAFGERITAITSPERMALGRAGLLLAPQIPLLFMGDEWGASTPFQFFVDFEDDPDLAKAVRDGRRREFKHFAAFSDEASVERIPDPTSADTFVRSKLDRGETARSPHREILAETRQLLATRAKHVVPLTRSRYRGSELRRPDSASLDVTWRYDGGALRFAANFGSADVTVPAPAGTVIWQSTGLAGDVLGALKPWMGFFSKET